MLVASCPLRISLFGGSSDNTYFLGISSLKLANENLDSSMKDQLYSLPITYLQINLYGFLKEKPIRISAGNAYRYSLMNPYKHSLKESLYI